MGPLTILFLTSGDVCPGFQSQGRSLACVLPRLCTMDSSDSPLVWHLLTVEVSMAAKPFQSRCSEALVEVQARAWTHNCPCHTWQARCCKPLGHSSLANLTILYKKWHNVTNNNNSNAPGQAQHSGFPSHGHIHDLSSCTGPQLVWIEVNPLNSLLRDTPEVKGTRLHN